MRPLILSAATAAALASAPALALDPGRATTQYMHDVWGAEAGLPQSSVNTILQTRDGYVWMGTQEGVVRFDGVRFTVWDKRDQPEMGDNAVRALLQDGDGSVWIGTGNGVVRFDGRRFQGHPTPPEGIVASLAQDGAGTIWVGMLTGLARLQGDRVVPEPSVTLPGREVRALLFDTQGALWIGTEAGLVRWRDGRAQRMEGLANPAVLSLALDRQGVVWVGTENGGVYRSRGDALERAAAGVRTNVLSLKPDRDGNLWIGSEGEGLLRLSPDGRLLPFASHEGLTNDAVLSLAEDREGALWIGTNGGGVNRLRDSRFTTLTNREGLPAENAVSLLQAHDGSVWIATYGGGLAHWQDGRVTRTWTTRDGLSENHLLSLYEDRAGRVWVGTNHGLDRVEDGRVTTMATLSTLPNDSVHAILEDREGAVWVGHNGGVTRLKDGHATTYSTANGLANNSVWVLMEGRDGALWIGTLAGLCRMQGGKLTTFTTGDGLPAGVILDLHEDPDGTLWIGTVGGGIARLKNGHITSLGMRQGLADDSVFRMLEDGQGHWWISNNKGLSRVSRRAVEDVLDGRPGRVQADVYGLADGMRSTECNGGIQPSGWRMSDGHLWFACLGGVVVIDPARLPVNPLPPPVVIESSIADGQATGPDALVLPAGTRALEVHYTALSLLDPGRVRFRYRLEGFDPDWIDVGTRRVAYYTNIPHGTYRFRVIAANNDGVWNEQGASLGVEVQPRLHERLGFRLLAGLCALALLYGGYRARVWRLHARERELEALVDERTEGLRQEKERTEAERARAEEASAAKSAFLANMSHELRTPLNAVLGFAQLMDRRPGRDADDRQNLATILHSGEHLLGLINEVLSLSKIEAGRLALLEAPFDLPSMIHDIEALMRLRADARDLALRVELAPEVPPMVVGDAGKLRQVLLNLIANAVKFTQAGGVTVRVSWSEGRGRFEVEDTGPGIDPAEQAQLFAPFVQAGAGRQSREGTGLGLAVSRQIARLMGGDVTLVRSAPGAGSTFVAEVTLPAAAGEAARARRLPSRRVAHLATGESEWRVLVVDDVRDNRTLLSGLLSSAGFAVQEAANGEEAIEIWRRWRPQLVWMDKRMPGVDGLEATRRMREEEVAQGWPRTAILALSASALDQDRAEILAAGFDEFVPKPFRQEAIFALMADHLGVHYVYDDGAGAGEGHDLDAARLSALPADWRGALREALAAGDLERAADLSRDVAARDAALSRELLTRIHAFRFAELEQMLAGEGTNG